MYKEKYLKYKAKYTKLKNETSIEDLPNDLVEDKLITMIVELIKSHQPNFFYSFKSMCETSKYYFNICNSDNFWLEIRGKLNDTDKHFINELLIDRVIANDLVYIKFLVIRLHAGDRIINDDTALINACKYDDTVIVNILLDQFDDNNYGVIDNIIDHVNNFGDSALHIICSKKNSKNWIDIIETLINIGDIDLLDDSHSTPLHYASKYGQKETVNFLLSNNANLNIQNNIGRTPIHEAIIYIGSEPVNTERKNNYLTLISNLITTDNKDMRDNSGNTALHHAYYHREHDIINILLQKGCNPTIQNNDGKTPKEIESIETFIGPDGELEFDF